MVHVPVFDRRGPAMSNDRWRRQWSVRCPISRLTRGERAGERGPADEERDAFGVERLVIVDGDVAWCGYDVHERACEHYRNDRAGPVLIVLAGGQCVVRSENTDVANPHAQAPSAAGAPSRR